MNETRKAISGIAALGIGLLTLSLSAEAQPRELDRARDRTSTAKHCIATLESTEPENRESGIRMASLASFSCYPTFSEAISVATNGTVELPEDVGLTTQLEMLQTELQQSIGTSYVLAIDYEHINYGGSTFTWVNSQPCRQGEYIVANSVPPGYKVGSTTGGTAGCNANIFYEHPNLGGNCLICRPSCSEIEVDTSSRAWGLGLEGASCP